MHSVNDFVVCLVTLMDKWVGIFIDVYSGHDVDHEMNLKNRRNLERRILIKICLKRHYVFHCVV